MSFSFECRFGMPTPLTDEQIALIPNTREWKIHRCKKVFWYSGEYSPKVADVFDAVRESTVVPETLDDTMKKSGYVQVATPNDVKEIFDLIKQAANDSGLTVELGTVYQKGDNVVNFTTEANPQVAAPAPSATDLTAPTDGAFLPVE